MKKIFLVPPAILVALVVAGAAVGASHQEKASAARIRTLEIALEEERKVTSEVKPAPASAAPVAAPAAEIDVARLLAKTDLASQEVALKAIAERKLVEHLPWLLDRLRTPGCRLLRIQVAETLGELANGSAIEPLRAAFDEHDLSMKRAAALALRKLGDARYVDTLVGCAEGYFTLPSAGMRRQAACELGLVGGAQAEVVLERARRDEDPDVRAEAARSLARIRS